MTDKKSGVSQKSVVFIFWESRISKANFMKSGHLIKTHNSKHVLLGQNIVFKENFWQWTNFRESPISSQFGQLNACMYWLSDVPILRPYLWHVWRSWTITFIKNHCITAFSSMIYTLLNCIARLPWECEWSWSGQRWVADCIVKQPAGWRMSWQEESGLALSCLAYNWPGEDVKWNLSRARVMEEKTSHVFIKEKMREGSQRETEGVDIMRFREKNKLALQYLFLTYVACLFFSISPQLAELLHCRNITLGFSKDATFSGNSLWSICLLVKAIKP